MKVVVAWWSGGSVTQASRRLSLLIEMLCWICGWSLVLAYASVRAVNSQDRWQAIEAFQQADSNKIRTQDMHMQSSDLDAITRADFSQWSRSRIAGYQASLRVKDARPLAVLRVQSVNLQVPVFGDTTEVHLNRGAGVIEGMALPGKGGNLGIAGHRDGFFRALKDVKRGDAIEITALHRIYRYRVASIEIVEESDARLLAQTLDPRVTLVTCYPFYLIGHAPRRFVVRGDYEGSTKSER